MFRFGVIILVSLEDIEFVKIWRLKKVFYVVLDSRFKWEEVKSF